MGFRPRAPRHSDMRVAAEARCFSEAHRSDVDRRRSGGDRDGDGTTEPIGAGHVDRAMYLLRDRPIDDVVSKLDLALPASGGTTARSSVSQARDRLGAWLSAVRGQGGRSESGQPILRLVGAIKI